MKRVSLHAGSNYVNPDAYGGWGGELPDCDTDASQTSAAAARLGFEARAFYDEAVTVGWLEESFKRLAAELEPGDVFLYTDSGHGGQELNPFIGTHETLCLYDGQYRDTDFRALVSLFKAGVNVITSSDRCHAGGQDKSRPLGATGRLAKVKQAPLYVCRRGAFPTVTAPRGADVACNWLHLAACGRDQLSLSTGTNGAYTAALLAALDGAPDKGWTWGNWFQATRAIMGRQGLEQVPEMHKVAGEDLSLALLVP